MIRKEDLTEIGAFHKTHGIKGELSATFDYDLEPDGLRCLVLEIDGIFVPFFIESWRGRGADRYLIKLEGINDETEASAISKLPIFGISSELPVEEDSDDDGVYLYDMIGYNLYDKDTPVGIIESINDTTENILFNVETSEGNIVYIPFAEELIESFDTEAKTIVMDLPEGIINLNN